MSAPGDDDVLPETRPGDARPPQAPWWIWGIAVLVAALLAWEIVGIVLSRLRA